jgi:cyclic pyranopterin phosphate synthase
MAEDMTFLPRGEVLSLEELARVARVFVSLGVDKIRLTGGEPLVRKDLPWLVREIAALPGLRELALTTNGMQLAAQAAALRGAGLQRINVSLDSLDPGRFRAITRVGDLARVQEGLRAARAAGFGGEGGRIKLNSVILRGRNDDEVEALAAFARDQDCDLAFIEEMPLGDLRSHDRALSFYPSDHIRADIARSHALLPLAAQTGGPARYYRMADSPIRVGFISPHSHNFCEQCNRVRVTAQGRLLLCLGQEHSADLRAVLRERPGDAAALQAAVKQAMALKPRGHDFQVGGEARIVRFMHHTGG